MHTYISMLRGINVSGQKLIKMTELKALYESLRLKNVATYIQSGNVIFQSKGKDPVSLGGVIEKAIEKSFGFLATVILRRPAEFRRVIDKCPFPDSAKADESRVYVTFLKSRPASALVKAMALVPNKSSDTYQISGNEIYLHCPNGYGKTMFSIAFFEKHLKVSATARNWRTVQTLLTMSDEIDHPHS
jgi:uncharacterized protein (DUF1697 family)